MTETDIIKGNELLYDYFVGGKATAKAGSIGYDRAFGKIMPVFSKINYNETNYEIILYPCRVELKYENPDSDITIKTYEFMGETSEVFALFEACVDCVKLMNKERE